MKRFALIFALSIVSLTPVLFILGLYSNLFLWNYSALSFVYSLYFALSIAAEAEIDSLLYLLLILLIIGVMIASIILSHCKYRRLSIVPVCFCLFDIVMSLLLGNFISVILDILLIIAINISKKEIEY